MNARRWLEHGLSVAVAGLFLAAAVPKIADPASFAKVIHAYKLTPDSWVNLLAVFLPWLELVAAIAVLTPGAHRRAGLWLCTAMLVVFTTAQVVNIQRGVKGTCGCFGSSTEPVGRWHLVVNVVAVVVSLSSMRVRVGECARARPGARRR